MIEQANCIDISVDINTAFEIYLLLISEGGQHVNFVGTSNGLDLLIIQTGLDLLQQATLAQLSNIVLTAIIHAHDRESVVETIQFKPAITHQWVTITSGQVTGEKIREIRDFLEAAHD